MTASAATIAAADVAIGATHLHHSELIAAIRGVVHGITRRVPGAGIADGNVGYSAPRDRNDAWRMRRLWLEAAGLDASRIVAASQLHGNDVLLVGAADAGRGADPRSRTVGAADSLVSGESGVVLMTLHADCMPILLCDPARRVVATIHAGWRGTVADIAGETLRRMAERFGTNPADVVAYLGPAIGECCYEVGDDVHHAWSSRAGDAALVAIAPAGERWRFDLAAANRSLLRAAGLRDERIETSGICTRCNGDTWFSHRGQGAATGRYAAFIALTDS